jgi:hypothetical protein
LLSTHAGASSTSTCATAASGWLLKHKSLAFSILNILRGSPPLPSSSSFDVSLKIFCCSEKSAFVYVLADRRSWYSGSFGFMGPRRGQGLLIFDYTTKLVNHLCIGGHIKRVERVCVPELLGNINRVVHPWGCGSGAERFG